jgi:hypothetical protein
MLLRIRILLLASSALLVASAVTAMSGPPALTLVIESALDPDAGFVERRHDEAARRLLLWDEGAISTPESTTWHEHGASDLAIILDRATVQATAAAGRLALDAGSFELDTPLLLADRTTTALLAGGRLTVDGSRLVYRRSATARVPRGGTLFMLAGLALATAVLLRAARKRTRRT